MPTLFTKIIKGEIPCHKIAEDERFLSFLDIRPINPGHALVIPKKEIDYLFDLDEDLLSNILLFSKKIAAALKKAVPCKRIGVMVYGLEVPHAHVHLVPIFGNKLGELSFAHAKPANQDALAPLAAKIRSYM
jgi:histidine triad (HIT) family protein